jgi:hypothetical protein
MNSKRQRWLFERDSQWTRSVEGGGELVMSLNIGVLIIGSLYWDNGARKKWREKRLVMNKNVPVQVGIRYGRLSDSRGKTYTMVFSDSEICRKQGQAKVVQGQQSVSSFNEFLIEAKWLWAAEIGRVPDSDADLKDSVSNDWGCVAVMPRPDLTGERKRLANEITEGWKEHISRVKTRPWGDNKPPYPPEPHLVHADGRLCPKLWPISIGDTVLDIDLLLATSNNPSDNFEMLTKDDLVRAWEKDATNPTRNQKEPNVRYFWNNYHNGFRTFQDEPIKEQLNRLGPSLSDPAPQCGVSCNS